MRLAASMHEVWGHIQSNQMRFKIPAAIPLLAGTVFADIQRVTTLTVSVPSLVGKVQLVETFASIRAKPI